MNQETMSFIKDIVPESVPILVALPGMISFKIFFQPLDYEYGIDGSERPQIKSIAELMSYCNGNDKERWECMKLVNIAFDFCSKRNALSNEDWKKAKEGIL